MAKAKRTNEGTEIDSDSDSDNDSDSGSDTPATMTMKSVQVKPFLMSTSNVELQTLFLARSVGWLVGWSVDLIFRFGVER